MNSLRPLLLILAWLLALLPADALALIPRRENLPPAFPVLRIAPVGEDDGGTLTLHLDGLHDRAGPCRRVLVRQNPWSKFDPEGLAAAEATVATLAEGRAKAYAGSKIAEQAAKKQLARALAARAGASAIAGGGALGFAGASTVAAGGGVVGTSGAMVGIGYLGILRTANIVTYGSPYPPLGLPANFGVGGQSGAGHMPPPIFLDTG